MSPLKSNADATCPRTARRNGATSHTGQLLDLARATGGFETLTLVLGYCGLRFGEAAALRRRDVGEREITVRSSATYVARQGNLETGTKTNRTRHVPVPEPIWERFEKELPDEADALVFPSRKGAHLPNHEYRRAFNKACKDVGIEGLVPHGLRHTCASLAISAGANVKVVQRTLGHATAAMTLDLYGHLMSDDLAGVAEALGKAIDYSRKGPWTKHFRHTQPGGAIQTRG